MPTQNRNSTIKSRSDVPSREFPVTSSKHSCRNLELNNSRHTADHYKSDLILQEVAIDIEWIAGKCATSQRHNVDSSTNLSLRQPRSVRLTLLSIARKDYVLLCTQNGVWKTKSRGARRFLANFLPPSVARHLSSTSMHKPAASGSIE